MDKSIIESNIRLLEQGITLQEYAEKEDLIKIDGKTSTYNEYGFFVIYNRTKNIYLLDGGDSPTGFSISTTISQFFFTDAGRGNPYMHQHYKEGDDMILKFHSYNPNAYSSMSEFKEELTKKYNEIGISYFDYLVMMKEKSDNSAQQMHNNQYYDRESKIKEKKTLTIKLLQLEHKSKFWYEVLNFIAGVFLKPIPLFIILLFNDRNLFWGKNIIQKMIAFIGNVLGAYFAAVMFYLIFLAVVQVFKLLFCKYKKLITRIRIFDIIIKIGAKKIYTREDIGLYREHINNKIELKNKINSGKEQATERYYEKKQEELKYKQQELEREEREFEYNFYNAKRSYKKASDGGGIFQSADSLSEEGNRYARKSIWNMENINRTEKEIEELERKISKKK